MLNINPVIQLRNTKNPLMNQAITLPITTQVLKTAANENLPTDLSQSSIRLSSTSQCLEPPSYSEDFITRQPFPQLLHLTLKNAVSSLQSVISTCSQSLDSTQYKKSLIDFISKNIRSIIKHDLSLLKSLNSSLLDQILTHSLHSSISHPYLNSKHILDLLLQTHHKSSYIQLLSEFSDCTSELLFTPFANFVLDPYSSYSSVLDLFGISFSVECKCIDGYLSLSLNSTGSSECYRSGDIVAISCMVKIEVLNSCSYSCSRIPICIGNCSQFNILGNTAIACRDVCTVSIMARIDYVPSAILIHMAKEPNDCLLTENLQGISKNELESVMRSRLFKIDSETDAVEIVARWVRDNIDIYQREGIQELLKSIKWNYVSVDGIVEITRKYRDIKDCKEFRELFKDVLNRKTGVNIAIQEPRASYKDKLSITPPSSIRDVVKSLGNFLISSEFTPDYKAQLHIIQLKKQRELLSKEEAVSALNYILDSASQSTAYPTSPPIGLDDNYSDRSHILPYKRSVASFDLHSMKLDMQQNSQRSSQEGMQMKPLLRELKSEYHVKCTAEKFSRLSV